MPAEFHKLGLAFQYPENWTLDEQDALAGRESVTVVSPGGAFWSVSIHPPGTDPQKLAKAAVKAMREEYTDLEAEAVHDSIAGRPLVGYELNFYYLDLTNTAEIRCLAMEQATYSIFCQAEDREYAQARPVFLAMLHSLVDHLAASQPQG